MSIEMLRSCKSIDHFVKCLEEYLLNYGIKYFCLHPATFHRHNIITNLPSEMIERYFMQEYNETDYIIDHAKNLHKSKIKAIYRHAIHDYSKYAPLYTEKNEKNVAISLLFREYGFLDAYYILYETPTKHNFIISILSKDVEREDFKNEIELRYDFIHLLFEIITNICCSSFSKIFFGAKSHSLVTHKQGQLINYLGKEDLTLKLAADRMHISLDTANKHIAAAKESLGLKTIPGLVYWGIKEGIIDLEETIHPRERRKEKIKNKENIKVATIDEKIVNFRQNLP